MLEAAKTMFNHAQQLIPGGVNSPVRCFGAVTGIPPFIKKAQGPYLYDIDGNSYIDYVGSWGPMVLGHNHPAVTAAVQEALQNGLSFGAPTILEIKLAEKIISLMPNIKMLRMVNSGTEATATAIRLARGYTQKNKIIKFAGCYHGHTDSLLVKAGSGNLTLSLPNSAGIPKELTSQTLVAPYNDINAVNQLFAEYPNDIAGIIVEPIAGNMNLILPTKGFLNDLRALCTKYSSLLIFDEVMTGFRVSLGGAQELYQIKPDLTCLGKIIGGGLPVGAIGGSKEIMSYLAPSGPVYQAGTLSGNPLAMAAGLATLQQIQKKPDFYQLLNQKADFLTTGILEVAANYKLDFYMHYVGGMFGFGFNNDPEHKLFKKFFHAMLADEIYLAPSPFEAGFISIMHEQPLLEQTINSCDHAFCKL